MHLCLLMFLSSPQKKKKPLYGWRIDTKKWLLFCSNLPALLYVTGFVPHRIKMKRISNDQVMWMLLWEQHGQKPSQFIKISLCNLIPPHKFQCGLFFTINTRNKFILNFNFIILPKLYKAYSSLHIRKLHEPIIIIQ